MAWWQLARVTEIFVNMAASMFLDFEFIRELSKFDLLKDFIPQVI